MSADKLEILSGVGIDLTIESKEWLYDLVSQLIPKQDYYQSPDPEYAYINGNVAKKAHITICYGIKNPDLKKQFDESKLEINWPKDCSVKEIQLNLGYQGLYYVIVAIPLIDEGVYRFNNWVRENNDSIPDSPSFDPHIALCYIKNSGEYPDELFEKLQEQLIGKTLEFDSVNFYKGDIKTDSIRLL